MEVPVEAPPPKKPNVLVVLWDTVRADHLSLYGYERPTTPRLEAFGREATVYENAVSPAMWTLPSHAAMFTGLPPTTHGADAHYRWLDHQHQTLAEILGANGYTTLAFSSNIIASPFTNLLQGFSALQTSYPRQGPRKNYYDKACRTATRAKLIPEDASTEISPAFQGNKADLWKASVAKDAAPIMHRALMDFIDKRAGDQPWFAYLNMMEAHSPRIPSLESRQALLSQELIDLGLKTDVSVFAETEYIVGKRDYSAAELEAVRGVYDAAVLDLDKATGALLAELRQRGLLDDTLVIVVADHGEALGEHRMFEHRWSMYETLLHVPLVVRYPPRFGAARIAERVSTIDLFATILDVAGIEAPPAAGRHSSSLVGRVYDQNVFAEMLDPWAGQLDTVRAAYPKLDVRPWTRTYKVTWAGDLKYIHASDGDHALYDLAADPGELTDLLPAAADRAEPLASALTAWEAEREPYPEAGRTDKDGPRVPQGKGQKEMLEALGYTDGEGAG